MKNSEKITTILGIIRKDQRHDILISWNAKNFTTPNPHEGMKNTLGMDNQMLNYSHIQKYYGIMKNRESESATDFIQAMKNIAPLYSLDTTIQYDVFTVSRSMKTLRNLSAKGVDYSVAGAKQGTNVDGESIFPIIKRSNRGCYKNFTTPNPHEEIEALYKLKRSYHIYS